MCPPSRTSDHAKSPLQISASPKHRTTENLTDLSKQAMVSQNSFARICLPSRHLVYFFTAGVFILLTLAACRPSSRTAPADYLVVGIESYPLNLDPRYATDANAV